MELAKASAHMDAECTADEMEQEAAWYKCVLINILDPTAKATQIYEK